MGFTLKVLLRILSVVNILNIAYLFRPKFYPLQNFGPTNVRLAGRGPMLCMAETSP
jgi:hypothetical protein